MYCGERGRERDDDTAHLSLNTGLISQSPSPEERANLPLNHTVRRGESISRVWGKLAISRDNTDMAQTLRNSKLLQYMTFLMNTLGFKSSWPQICSNLQCIFTEAICGGMRYHKRICPALVHLDDKNWITMNKCLEVQKITSIWLFFSHSLLFLRHFWMSQHKNMTHNTFKIISAGRTSYKKQKYTNAGIEKSPPWSFLYVSLGVVHSDSRGLVACCSPLP